MLFKAADGLDMDAMDEGTFGPAGHLQASYLVKIHRRYKILLVDIDTVFCQDDPLSNTFTIERSRDSRAGDLNMKGSDVIIIALPYWQIIWTCWKKAQY
jgi:hypothetical protein